MREGGRKAEVVPLQVIGEQSSNLWDIPRLHRAEGMARLIRHFVKLDCSGESHSRPKAREVHLWKISKKESGRSHHRAS